MNVALRRLYRSTVSQDLIGFDPSRYLRSWMRARTVAQSVDQQRNHAPSVFGSLRVSVHTQARDRAQKLLGGNIGANVASGVREFCGSQ